MIDFLTFQTVITPYIVIAVYLLGALLIPIIIMMVSKKLSKNFNRWLINSMAVIVFLFSELVWRMMNEFVIVYFKIYQVLQ